MKYATASIIWEKNENGDRLINPTVGSFYYPLIYLDNSFVNRIINKGWSIKFLVTEADRNDLCTIKFRMLVNNQESLIFFDKLRPGSRFYLTEGRRKVAEGRIQEIVE